MLRRLIRTAFLPLAAFLFAAVAAPSAKADLAYCPIQNEAPKTVSGTTYTIALADQCSMLVFTSGSSVAVTLPNAATTFPVGFKVKVRVSGAGTVTITPTTSTINGASTLVLAQGSSGTIVSDGTNYQAAGTVVGASGATVPLLSGSNTFSGALNTFTGHIAAGPNANSPALTSCGTGPAIVGDDKDGQVTMGTGTPTGCVITFHVAYTATPLCTVVWVATPLASQSYAVANTAITLTQSATSSNVVNYHCAAQNGG